MREVKKHEAVMVSEVINNLIINSNGKYLDCTYGLGGHTKAILNQLSSVGSLLAIDRDSSSLNSASKISRKDDRFHFSISAFSNINDIEEATNLDGILADLGISSFQLDEARRGFSFNKEAPLDMRMDQTNGLTAEQWINTANKKELEAVFWNLGEARNSRRIVRKVIERRQVKALSSTKELADLIISCTPRKTKKHPATNIFRAIRMHINNEVQELRNLLIKSENALRLGGRIAVISFHSIEDRIVKRFFQGKDRSNESLLKVITKKPIKPSEEEIKNNPRSRSAILRVAEKVC